MFHILEILISQGKMALRLRHGIRTQEIWVQSLVLSQASCGILTRHLSSWSRNRHYQMKRISCAVMCHDTADLLHWFKHRSSLILPTANVISQGSFESRENPTLPNPHPEIPKTGAAGRGQVVQDMEKGASNREAESESSVGTWWFSVEHLNCWAERIKGREVWLFEFL